MQAARRASAHRRTRSVRRRDRRGRGMRGVLAPAQVPLSRSRGEIFDDLVADAVDDLEQHWAAELAGVEFAVEDVPPEDAGPGLSSDVVGDRGVALGRVHREGLAGLPGPVLVVYRRPVEARAGDEDERAELVFMVVAELVADLLGRDVDEIDPG